MPGTPPRAIWANISRISASAVSTDTRIYGIALAPDDPWFGSVQGVRHTIVPRLGFTYAPEIDSNPRFVPNPGIGQGTAYQAEQRTVNLGLEQRAGPQADRRRDTGRAGESGAGAPQRRGSERRIRGGPEGASPTSWAPPPPR